MEHGGDDGHGKDDGLDPVAQVEYLGKTTDAVIVLPYGVCANAPTGSNAVLFSLGGSSLNKLGIPYNVENRFRDLKEGEVQIGNFVEKCSIKFNEDGGIEVIAKDDQEITITNGSGTMTMNSSGQLNVNGNLTVDA